MSKRNGPTPGQIRLTLLRLIKQHGRIRVLENSKRLNVLMALCETGDVTVKSGNSAGIHKTYDFTLTPKGDKTITKRIANGT